MEVLHHPVFVKQVAERLPHTFVLEAQVAVDYVIGAREAGVPEEITQNEFSPAPDLCMYSVASRPRDLAGTSESARSRG